MLKKRKEMKGLSKMAKEIGLSKSIIFCEMNLYELIIKYSKLKHFTLSMYFMKNNVFSVKWKQV